MPQNLEPERNGELNKNGESVCVLNSDKCQVKNVPSVNKNVFAV